MSERGLGSHSTIFMSYQVPLEMGIARYTYAGKRTQYIKHYLTQLHECQETQKFNCVLEDLFHPVDVIECLLQG